MMVRIHLPSFFPPFVYSIIWLCLGTYPFFSSDVPVLNSTIYISASEKLVHLTSIAVGNSFAKLVLRHAGMSFARLSSSRCNCAEETPCAETKPADSVASAKERMRFFMDM